jgi:hypothetical protein
MTFLPSLLLPEMLLLFLVLRVLVLDGSYDVFSHVRWPGLR